MSSQNWLHHLRSALVPAWGHHQHGLRGRKWAATHRLGLEILEDRRVPAFLAPVDYPAGEGPTVGDFNSDGIQDLATASFGTGSVSVLLGNPDGTFQPAGSSYAGDGAPLSLAVGDFNEDGKLDLATGSNYDDYAQFGVDDVTSCSARATARLAPKSISEQTWLWSP